MASFNVEKQGYHGGSLVGHSQGSSGNNYFFSKKLAFPYSQKTSRLCNSVIVTATSLNRSALQCKANEINDKFMDAFNLFAQCHTIYDSNTLLTEAKINELGMKIYYFTYL